MEKLVPAVALAFALGVLLGAVGPGVLAGPPSNGSDGVPMTLSSSGPGCFEGPTPNAGWVHEVAAGESYAVTLNATVLHDRGTEVRPNVSEWSPRRFRLDFRTVSDEGEDPKEPQGRCRVATEFRLGLSLPTDYERLDIAVNGRTVRTVEREDTTADLYRLPNPVNATGR